jgi:ribonuclease Z
MTFELTILGSSSAIPSLEKFPTSQVLNVRERFFLIDCGEGTQFQLKRLNFSLAKIRHIFISHLHGDHFFGLPGFISTRNLMGITSDIHIYSHSLLIELLKPILNHMKGDMGFEIIFHPLNTKKTEQIFADNLVEVLSFPLKHSIPCCGFLFMERSPLPNMRKEKIIEYQIPVRQIQAIKEGADYITDNGTRIANGELILAPHLPRSYAFCTDTAYYEPAAEVIQHVDLLYHEATFMNELSNWANKTYHSTAKQAATMAFKSNAKKLIIGHISSRYKNPELVLKEAKEVFPETELAVEGMKFFI